MWAYIVVCPLWLETPLRAALIVAAPHFTHVPFRIRENLLDARGNGRATVSESKDLQMTAPGTDDPVYLLRLELRSDDEPDPWDVEIGQRVPKGASPRP